MKPSEVFQNITNQTGLYNIQSIDNIASIMRRGLLSNEKAKRIVHTSIAMNIIQERREHIRVPNGLQLHQYANVYFDPHNPMLSAKRNLNDDICILKFDCSILDISGTVVSDRNASSDYASFYPPIIGMNEINFELVYARYWIDNDYYIQMEKKSIKCAEVLVPYCIPYTYVVCAAVISDKAANKLADTGFDRTIEVVPRVFF